MSAAKPTRPRSDPQLYARSFTDVYQHWYDDLDDPDVLVQAFRQQCPHGARIVELGSGTGRLATPLHQAGFRVDAVDASSAMLNIAGPGPHAVGADMAALPLVTGCADGVLIAYNTLFNLDGEEQQQRCFHEVARVLRRGGVLAIEAFIADLGGPSSFGITIRDHPARPGGQLAIITGPDEHDPDVIVGSHVELGNPVVCRPWRLRYRSPDQLDAAAAFAGLTLRARHSDWAGATFDPAGHRHVSWYERT